MKRSHTTVSGLATAGLAAAALALGAGDASAAVTCSKWAATTGSDLNAGTQAAPFRTLDKLVRSLSAGQAGCLPAGQTYYVNDPAADATGVVASGASGITITSGP